MNLENLGKLNATVSFLLKQENILKIIEELQEAVHHTEDSFVWSSLDLNEIKSDLPEKLKSGWIFVLKANVASGCHYHPNSIQHMVMLSGEGESQVAGIKRRMLRFGTPGCSLDEIWYVIGEGVKHEFFPEESEMVVMSFHTCGVNELEEISCQTGERRLYEK
jgi:hypothetical protein